MAIPPNFGVGFVCICLLPGRAIAPLLCASDITTGTVAKEIINAIKKIIYGTGKIFVSKLIEKYFQLYSICEEKSLIILIALCNASSYKFILSQINVQC